jgi:hypothetical protein
MDDSISFSKLYAVRRSPMKTIPITPRYQQHVLDNAMLGAFLSIVVINTVINEWKLISYGLLRTG